MKRSIACLSIAASVCFTSIASADEPPAQAQTLGEAITGGKPLINFRMRYENVEQDASPALDDANAWTLRSLIGWQTKPFFDFGLTLQLIGLTKLNDHYNDFENGVNQSGKAGIAVVNDPDFFNVNQLYIDYTGLPDTRIRAGRQSIKLDNVRFIGNVEFRQVMQVFDGITVENKSLPNIEIIAGYYTRLRKVNTDLRSDNSGILHAAYKLSPSETLTGYVYLYDMEHMSIAKDVSNVTFGLRADGAHKLGDHWKALYTAEYAKQNDFDDSDKRTAAQGKVDAHYYRLGLGAGYDDWFARVDHELLSSNGGKYGFQTPLGTNHLFQGWVDKLLTTPIQGIRDTFITAGGKVMDVTLLTEYHWIDSDKDFAKVGGGMGDRFATEWDVSAAYAYDKHWTGKIEYGTYREKDQRLGAGANGRIRDTDKLWLTVIYNY